MALAIATNNAALNAAASASSVNRDMETSMARLSTGKRINSASDDAAGVAISSRLSAEIRGTDQAIRNSLDGQALIDTAEGAHKEIENILQRMREVAVQAANDTNNDQDRGNLAAEMTAMVSEIDRISDTTTWAGADLMMDAKTSFSFQVGAATGEPNQIKISIDSMGAAALGIGASTAAEVQTRATAITDYQTLKDDAATAATDKTTADDAKTAADNAATGIGALVTTLDDAIANGDAADVATAVTALEGMAGFVAQRTDENQLVEMEAIITGGQTDDGKIAALRAAFNAGAGHASELTAALGHAGMENIEDTTTAAEVASATSVTANALVTAATNANSTAVTAASDKITADDDLAAATDPGPALSTSGLAVDSGDNARDSITAIDSAILKVNDQRSALGAVSNRLNHTVNNLTNISSNLSAAKGGIEDADFALETTNLAKNQILQQASTAMLAQANASKQNVLSLLQG